MLRIQSAAVLAASLAFSIPGLGAARPIIAQNGAAHAAANPTDAVCNARANTTLPLLLACIQEPFLWQHLVDLQHIADANPDSAGHGNRNTGTNGYLQSADYVAALMTKAGYHVTLQAYPWRQQAATGTPVFAMGTQHFQPERDWFPARQTGAGRLTAPITVIAGHDGCAARDFDRFTPGHIALLAPATCGIDAQVANAVAAHAGAVIVANTAHSVRLARGVRTDGAASPYRLAAPAPIPVIATASRDVGASLRRAAASSAPPLVHIDLQTRMISGTDYNVIADSPFGDPSHIVVIDAHLDAIYGAGMLDNGSGSATILEIALKMAHSNTANQLRFIWFGGEELGLLGSAYYTTHLAPADLANIAFDLDVDVTATPNYDVLIADPGHATNKAKFPPNVVPQSQPGNAYFTAAFSGAGIASRLASFGNDGTDSNSFSLVGVPNTGILTNQDCCKSAHEVSIWGGFLGDYEGVVPGRGQACVDQPRRWCDNLSNNDPFVLEFVSKATANVAFMLANDTTLAAARRAP